MPLCYTLRQLARSTRDPMKRPDTLQRFLFEHANIRGEIVHLDGVYQTIMNQHPYPAEVKRLLGEALVSCLLAVGTIKFEGEISLQFHGDERLPLLLVQCDHLLNVRAFAQYQDDLDSTAYDDAFVHGKLVLTINQYQKTQAYQSVVPIHSTEMAENIMHYFAQSEQISTRLWLAVNDERAVGMLLQLLPEKDSLQREQFWEYAVQLGQTIEENELLTLDNETILHRLYHETELRLYPERTVRFRCRCNEEKMKQVLTVVEADELQALLQEEGEVTIRCDFCNKAYTFDVIDVAMLLRK